jgi:acyl carrier protein phosphodiesterase
MIAVLHTWDRTCPCIRTYTASYRRVDKMAIEEYKRRWQILVSSQGVVQGFRANIVRLYKKSPDNYTRVKKQLWEKQWVVLPKKPLEVLNRWWNI